MHMEFSNYQMVMGLVKNVIIFGADMHLLVHIDSKKYVFILGKAPIDGLNDTT